MPTRRRASAAPDRRSPRPQATTAHPLDTAQDRRCRAAWERYVLMLAGPPLEWSEVVEAFVEAMRPRHPDRTRALVLLFLSLAREGWPSFVDGGWIGRVPTHVYVHYDGPDGEDANALQLAAHLVEWARAEGQIDDAEAERLHAEIAMARASVILD